MGFFIYNICCQYFDKDTYRCSERRGFLGARKRCVCVPNISARCDIKLEYPDDEPPPPHSQPPKLY